MHIPFSRYLFVIALPFLIFFVPILVNLILSVMKLIKKKEKAIQDFLFWILALGFLLSIFYGRLLPTFRLLMDVGAEHSYAEGRVNYKRFDQSYEHSTYSGWIVDIDSEKYYILEDSPIPQGDVIRIEYLPHSRMIINWERTGDESQ